jgi:ribosome-associated protein
VSDSEQTKSAATIRLDDFLKLTGLVATGGEAKVRIQSGEVTLNGEIETRRRKQLVLGDVIEFMGETFEVSADDESE